MENVTAVKTKIEFKCGCGFNTNKEGLAEEHTMSTGHTLSVHGSVQPETAKAES